MKTKRQAPNLITVSLATGHAVVEALENRRLLTAYVVTTTADSGAGSLRDAITAANSNPGLDSIGFDIPGAGLHTIELASPLPNITGAVTIDGSTNDANYVPGNAPVVQVDGINAGANAIGFQLGAGFPFTDGDSTIKDLAITGFGDDAIVIDSDSNLIIGDYIGTADGLVAAPNHGSMDTGSNGGVQTITGNGIYITGGDNQIGGTELGDRNVISGNAGDGIYVAHLSSVVIAGNYIGLTADGSAALPNGGDGVYTNGQDTTIGGTTAAARNIISGNQSAAIAFYQAAATIEGNYIGLNAAGTAVIANGVVLGAGLESAITLGGTTAGAGNVIDGPDEMEMSLTTFKAVGNFVGTDGTGQQNLEGGESASPTLIAAVQTGADETTVTFTLPYAGDQQPFADTAKVDFYSASSPNHTAGGDDWTSLYTMAVTGNLIDGPQAVFTAVIPSLVPSDEVIAVDATFYQSENSQYIGLSPMQVTGFSTIAEAATDTVSTPQNSSPPANSTTAAPSSADPSTAVNGSSSTASGTMTATLSIPSATAQVVSSTNPTAIVGLYLTSNAHATVALVTGRTVKLLARATDVVGGSDLTYTWSAINSPSGGRAAVYSANGTNAARSTTATFMKAGTYRFRCTISNGHGDSVVSDVSVTVAQTATNVASLAQRIIHEGHSFTYHAYVYDQFRNEMKTQPSIRYSIAKGPGHINARTGGYTAGLTAGSVLIKAKYGSLSTETYSEIAQ